MPAPSKRSGPSGKTDRAIATGRSAGTRGSTIDPSITSSKTARATSSGNSRGMAGGNPAREATPDVTNRERGSAPNPVPVQSGPKITRISEP